MLRFKDGDTAAFDELVRRNTPKVHALIFRFLGGDVSLLDDLTQEVFLRVYRTAGRYEPTAKFSTWLYRVTANLAFNVLRDRRRGTVYSLDTVEGEEGDFHRELADPDHTPPGQALDDRELAQRVAQAIAELPDNQRIAIVLNKYEEKGYDEISQVLDMSTMAVKSLLSRARENLRQSLEKYLRKG